MNRTQLLNILIDRYQYSAYLELGVDRNVNFNNIDLADKTGVDIKPNATYSTTTDKFFEICHRKFDLIFIDAHHEAEQAYRDFTNSLTHLNDGGCIVFHDCMPKQEIHQTKRRRSNSWTGDVWKAFVRVRQRADVNAFVLDADWGLGIVFKQPNTDQVSHIRPLNWQTYVDHHLELLRVVPITDLYKTLPAPTNPKNIWITTQTNWGAIGHQYQEMSAAMVIAEIFGLNYFYTGFDTTTWDFSLSDGLNHYLNFTEMYDQPQNENPTILLTYFASHWWSGLDMFRKFMRSLPANSNIVLQNAIFFSIHHYLMGLELGHDVLPGTSQKLLHTLQTNMRQTRFFNEFQSDFGSSDSSVLNVAAYVRGGGKRRDNIGYCGNPLPKTEYDKIIQRIQQDYPDKQLNITYYTQGPMTDLDGDFSNEKVVINDGEFPRLYEIWKTMMTADVYIGGLSSFSTMISLCRTAPTYCSQLSYFVLNGTDIIV